MEQVSTTNAIASYAQERVAGTPAVNFAKGN
jgi:hypothetical protein